MTAAAIVRIVRGQTPPVPVYAQARVARLREESSAAEVAEDRPAEAAEDAGDTHSDQEGRAGSW